MEAITVDDASMISEAIVLWTGKGRTPWPQRDENRVVERFGPDKARDLMPVVRNLEKEFYKSDAEFTVADLAEMMDVASAQFEKLHPELTNEAIEAFAWCYAYSKK
jgi:hypothetical protein